MKMPTIGVAGVTIPGAVDCIHKINRSSGLYFSNNEHPSILLYQPNFGIMQSALQNQDWDKVLSELSKSVQFLSEMGADFAIIPANSVHKVIDELREQNTIPILNMLEIVANACSEKKLKKIGIMGTIWTMSGHLYKAQLEKNGMEEIIPSEQEQKIIQDAIFSEIIPTARVKPGTLAALLDIVNSLKKRGCDAVALACTELPLVLNEENCATAVIDTTEALAQAALYSSRKAFSHPPPSAL